MYYILDFGRSESQSVPKTKNHFVSIFIAIADELANPIFRQSGVRSCIMPGLPTHLVQELNVGTVCVHRLAPDIGVRRGFFYPNMSIHVYQIESLLLDIE